MCHPIYSGRQACGRTSRGHTGFLHIPSAVLVLFLATAAIDVARRGDHEYRCFTFQLSLKKMLSHKT